MTVPPSDEQPYESPPAAESVAVRQSAPVPELPPVPVWLSVVIQTVGLIFVLFFLATFFGVLIENIQLDIDPGLT